MIKKYFLLMVAALLSLTAVANKWQGTVLLHLTEPDGSDKYLEAVAIFDDVAGTATLGNGYNACISHFEEGRIYIPAYYDDNENGKFRVEIGKMAFRFCSCITEVDMADGEIDTEGVTTIGDYAFVGCSRLTTITLPKTLTTIGSGAFAEMPSLKVVKSNATTAPTWQWNDVFSALGTKASMNEMADKRFLYVPEGALESYVDYKFDGTTTDAHENVGWADAFTRIYELNDEPQTISSLSELAEFRDAVNAGTEYKGSRNQSVTLTADIDMSTETNWTPIGTDDHRFDGTFDGGGHVIKNLSVNNTEAIAVGLFGTVQEATIYHLHMLNPVVTGLSAGAVAGFAKDSRITDVLVTNTTTNGQINVNGQNCGGIVGGTSNVVIERSLFHGRLVNKGRCGGIVGFGRDAVTITDCSASNSILNDNGGLFVGGIVGYASQAQVTLNRCMARNTLTKEGAIAGWLVGEIDQGEKTNTISNSVYYVHDTNISMTSITQAPLSYDNNNSYSQETDMMGDATQDWLGDDWYYFTKEYHDYPVPETLVDMYFNHVLLSTDNIGWVFTPIGEAGNITSYEVIGYQGTETTLSIPSTFNNKDVTGISADAFNGNTTITRISLNQNVQRIGDRAFYGSAIETLTLYEGVITIGESAFEECDALEEVDIPYSVTTIKARAFRGCDNLSRFLLGSGFRDYEDNFIAYCPNLTDLNIRANNNDFLCENNVLIHKVSNNICEFIACANDKKGDYTLPTFTGYRHINVLGDCFGGCTGLTSITFPDDHRYWLGERAFNGATNLRYINMSNVEICERDKEKSVSYDVDRQEYNDPFYGVSNSTFIFLPEGHDADYVEPNVVIGNKADNILLTDGWDFYTPVDIEVNWGVTYDRILKATRTEITQTTGNKIIMEDENGNEVEMDELEVTDRTYTPCGYSVYLPYALRLNADNAKVYTPTAIEPASGTATVVFTEVKDKQMEAYTPYYIVVSGEEEVNLNTAYEVTEVTSGYTAPTVPTQNEYFEFKGSTTTISNADLYDDSKSTYILQSDSNWHKVPENNDGVFLSPYRAYFQLDGQTTGDLTVLVSKLGDEQGVITSMPLESSSPWMTGETYYSLDGRRLSGKPTQRGIYINNGRKVVVK